MPIFSITKRIKTIQKKAAELQSKSNQELKLASLQIKYQRCCGIDNDYLVMQALPIAVEAARRSLGLVMHGVQIGAGIELCRGRIAEMRTGEGKTLTALLPIYYFALAGKGVHVVTVNDYLAERDCNYLKSAFELLGISADHIVADHSPEHRKDAYKSDVVYAAGKEFGFDFLRDRMKADPQARIQRGLHFALIDEADSIMLDEARTPLIIGMHGRDEEKVFERAYRWAAKHASKFEETRCFRFDHQKQLVTLTSIGRLRARRLAETDKVKGLSLARLYQFTQNAIKVNRIFILDKQYSIIDGQIVIIDESTGRPAEGRQWQGGIHQAVDAKEGLEITPATKQAATITMQSFLKSYTNFSGMTGTAWTARREFRSVYRRRVVRIPTHRPVIRRRLPTIIVRDFEAKMRAVVEETEQIIRAGRAVLIGTRSVEKSEMLSAFLSQRGLSHEVLNARHLKREAEIVALAGMPRRITVATNMAGRGTDIKLADSVRSAGGLHVILTELHESQRIDWQLVGRASRQGDPGSFRSFLAATDEILTTAFGPKRADVMRKKMIANSAIPSRFERYFHIAQLKIENRHLIDRMILLRQDTERHKQHFDMGLDPYLNAVGQ